MTHTELIEEIENLKSDLREYKKSKADLKTKHDDLIKAYNEELEKREELKLKVSVKEKREKELLKDIENLKRLPSEN